MPKYIWPVPFLFASLAQKIFWEIMLGIEDAYIYGEVWKKKRVGICSSVLIEVGIAYRHMQGGATT